MQKPSTQGVGGAAVHVVPVITPEEAGRLAEKAARAMAARSEDESLIALARLLGFEIEDDDGPYWRPGMKLRAALGLPEFGDAPMKTQAARDALKAMADAINERLGR